MSDRPPAPDPLTQRRRLQHVEQPALRHGADCAPEPSLLLAVVVWHGCLACYGFRLTGCATATHSAYATCPRNPRSFTVPKILPMRSACQVYNLT
jgi:hypothetical protein